MRDCSRLQREARVAHIRVSMELKTKRARNTPTYQPTPNLLPTPSEHTLPSPPHTHNAYLFRFLGWGGREEEEEVASEAAFLLKPSIRGAKPSLTETLSTFFLTDEERV